MIEKTDKSWIESDKEMQEHMKRNNNLWWLDGLTQEEIDEIGFNNNNKRKPIINIWEQLEYDTETEEIILSDGTRLKWEVDDSQATQEWMAEYLAILNSWKSKKNID